MSDLDRLKELQTADTALVERLVGMFNEQYEDLLAKIKMATLSENSQKIKETAHTLKGVCMNLGFNTMGEYCRKVEELGLNESYEQIPLLLNSIEESYSIISEEVKTLSNHLQD